MKKISFFVIVVFLLFNLVSAEDSLLTNQLDLNRVPSEVKPLPDFLNAPISLIVHGDTHAGYDEVSTEVHSQIVSQILAYKPSMVFHTGDVVHGQWGGPENWDIFHEIAGKVIKKYPYYPTIGNHDASIGVEYYLEYFDGLPNAKIEESYYYVEHPDAIFIVLDVDSLYPTGNAAPLIEQEIWLDQILTKFSDKTYKFVFFHRASYTSGSRGPCLWAREFDDEFVNHGVDVVFMGHIHAYERFYINGIHYIATGGGGGIPHTLDTSTDYPLNSRKYSVVAYHYLTVEGDSESIEIKAHNLDGSVFDSITVTPEQGDYSSDQVRDKSLEKNKDLVRKVQATNFKDLLFGSKKDNALNIASVWFGFTIMIKYLFKPAK